MAIYDELYAQVHEIEANLRRREALAGEAANSVVEWKIPGGIGTVAVAGTGALVSVKIDPHGLTSTNGRALGAQIAQAIRDAERKVRTNRAEILNESSGNRHI